MQKKKIESVFVIGKRWFDKVNGNTYHSVEIFIDGVMVKNIGMTYGYDDCYIQTAMEWLFENGYVTEKYSPSRYFRENGINFNSRAYDVSRKRDL